MTECIQQHPAYYEGFYDAQAGAPLWAAECTPEYKAGWEAYWRCRDALDRWSTSAEGVREK